MGETEYVDPSRIPGPPASALLHAWGPKFRSASTSAVFTVLPNTGQDEHLQETDGKIGHPRHSPKHRCAARKATSTEAARVDTEPDAQSLAKQTKLSTTETPAMNPENFTAHFVLTGTQFVCFCHWLLGKLSSSWGFRHPPPCRDVNGPG